MTSLTREDARRRAAQVVVQGYRIVLDLALGDGHFGSVATIRFEFSGAVGDTTFVDVHPHDLRSITLNGAALDTSTVFDVAAGRMVLRPRAGANELVVDAVMSYSHDGEGLHRHVDPADGRGYVYAMSFLDAAPRWFACFDQPDLKAPVSLELRCPPDWRVAGNGPAAEVEPGRWQVARTGPLATYFTTLIAGPYTEVRDEHDGIPLVLHARRSMAEYLDRDAAELMQTTKRCLDELHALFGVRYPWGEYHQAFVPEFNAGAMENPGCVTLADTMLFRSRVTDSDRRDRAVTIAHEMAHMWFGDLVTMRWWDDLWLNESFAEYLGHRVSGPESWVDFGIERKTWGYAADRRPSTHPVAGNGAIDADSALSEFDGISYAKGASALRQLALRLGDDVFLAGLRSYIAGHANGNAALADLLGAWTSAGAIDLDDWANRWLRTTGLDDLSVDNATLVRRAPGGTARVHALSVATFGADGVELGRQRVEVRADATPLDLVAGTVVLPDADDETWAKLVLPATTWNAMPAALRGIASPQSRVAVWNALQLAVADADVNPAQALDLVLQALPGETVDAVTSIVGRWATRVAQRYLPDRARRAALGRICDSALHSAHAAPPGCSGQLAAARTAIRTCADRALLRSWLAGEALPPGLLIDTDLRWAVLTRLAFLGDVGPREIDAAADADHSSDGAVQAARCRAARPDPVAKAAAWQTIMSDPDVANYQLYAAAEGFWDPDQRALTATYVPRYFEQIGATATLRSGWVVDRLALLAYPWAAVDAATLAATEALLASEALDSGIRRSVVDAGDDLRRALRSRARFG